MPKPDKRDVEQLDVLLTIRLAAEDKAALAELVKRHPLAKRGAVAREVFRRGLDLLRAKGGKD
jgi:hypothetical protein